MLIGSTGRKLQEHRLPLQIVGVSRMQAELSPLQFFMADAHAELPIPGQRVQDAVEREDPLLLQDSSKRRRASKKEISTRGISRSGHGH